MGYDKQITDGNVLLASRRMSTDGLGTNVQIILNTDGDIGVILSLLKLLGFDIESYVKKTLE